MDGDLLKGFRQRYRQGALALSGVGVVTGASVDLTPGVALVLVGIALLVLDRHVARSRRMPWGGQR